MNVQGVRVPFLCWGGVRKSFVDDWMQVVLSRVHVWQGNTSN